MARLALTVCLNRNAQAMQAAALRLAEMELVMPANALLVVLLIVMFQIVAEKKDAMQQ